MTDQGARCPQCQVTFRVTPPQLQAAGGRVRCGFCLIVFDAGANPAVLAAEPAPERPAWLRDEREWHPDDGFDRARLRVLLGPHPGTLAPAPAPAPAPTPPIAPPIAPPTTAAPAPTAASAPATGTAGAVEPPLLLWATTAPARRAGSWAGNAAILLAGGLLLAAQVLYFQADRLADEPRLRPLYRALCTALPCRFAATGEQAPGVLRVDNALVRPLPPDGLRLDAMLTNGSGRRLSLPALRIDFEDLDARPVAGRTLRPEEYLDAGAPTELAAGQALHLILDLYDPGPAAVSYRVTPLD